MKYRDEAGGDEGQPEFQRTNCTVSNLQPDTLYYLSIAAVNDGGEGPFSGDHLCHTKQKGV